MTLDAIDFFVVPTPVAWTRVFAPESKMGPTDAAQQDRMIAASPMMARYGQSIDRESAYEILAAKLQAGIEKQCTQAWKNIGQVLKAAGMGFRDIVKINVFLTDSRFIGPYRASREQFIGAAPYPASTLLIVQGLADPGMLVEIEAVAAK